MNDPHSLVSRFGNPAVSGDDSTAATDARRAHRLRHQAHIEGVNRCRTRRRHETDRVYLRDDERPRHGSLLARLVQWLCGE